MTIIWLDSEKYKDLRVSYAEETVEINLLN